MQVKRKSAIEIDIVPMTVKDIGEIMPIEQASFSFPWKSGTFIQGLKEVKNFKALVARQTPPSDEKIIGYVIWFDLGEEYHIINLAVHPGYRRMNVGTRLVESLLSLALERPVMRLTLEVRQSNEGAISFYHACGFITVAFVENYYQDNGECARVMWYENRRALTDGKIGVGGILDMS